MASVEFSQKKVDFTLRVSEIGATALGVLILVSALNLPVAVGAAAFVVTMASVLVMFRNRKHDEFLERNWNSGATTAFFSICLWALLAPFVIGVIDGVTGSEQGRGIADIIFKQSLLIALVTFFAGFHASRLRSA